MDTDTLGVMNYCVSEHAISSNWIRREQMVRTFSMKARNELVLACQKIGAGAWVLLSSEEFQTVLDYLDVEQDNHLGTDMARAVRLYNRGAQMVNSLNQ